MNKRILLAWALLSAATATQAQVRLSVGPQVGYTLATANYQHHNIAFDNGYRSGFSGGLTAELGVGHLLVRPAVLYTQKGYNQTFVGAPVFNYPSVSHTNRTRIDYLTVPLSIGYAQHADGQGLQVFGGAYVGFVLGGHYANEWAYSSPTSPTRYELYDGRVVADGKSFVGNDLSVRSPDFGLQAGLGYRYQRLLAQAEFSLGLRNAEPDRITVDALPTYHNRVFQLSLAYLFGLKS